MKTMLLTMALAGFLPSDGASSKREPNPLAPSLPLLSDEEEKKQDDIIDRFIDYDSGMLHGAEAKAARADFDKLGSEATFALIRGLNRAAKIEHSCPAVVIARKLARIFNSTEDTELLQFARENIGLEVGKSRHMAVLQDLKVACTFRKGALARKGISDDGTSVKPAEKPFRSLSEIELAEEAGSERGLRLKKVLRELGLRKGDDAVSALAAAASAYEADVQRLARFQLTRVLARLSEEDLKEKIKDERPEVRMSVIRVIKDKKLPWGKDLIALLEDENAGVREEAHQALVKMNQGKDLGPAKEASAAARAAAAAKWKEWWATEGGEK